MQRLNFTRKKRLGVVLYAIATLLFFFAYTHRVIPTVIVSDLRGDFAVSAAVLGFMLSGYFYGYAVSQPIVGVLVDRIGPGKVLAIFAFIATCGIIVSATSTSPTWMFLGRLITGFGAGGDWVPGLKIIARYFRPRRHGILAGIVSAGGLSGGIVATAPYALLVEFMAWRNSFYLLAAVTLTLGILALLTSRRINLIESNSESLSKHNAPGAVRHQKWLTSIRNCITKPMFWFIAMFLFLMGAILMTFQGLWGVPFLLDIYGLSRVSASNVIMLLAIGFVSSSLFSGFLIDRYVSLVGKWLIFGYSLATFCFFILFIWPDSLPLGVIALLCFSIGFGMGALVCIFKITPLTFAPEVYATSWGFLNIFSFLGTLLYQPISGWIMDTFGVAGLTYSVAPYRALFLVLAISGVGTVVASTLISRALAKLYQRNGSDTQ